MVITCHVTPFVIDNIYQLGHSDTKFCILRRPRSKRSIAYLSNRKGILYRSVKSSEVSENTLLAERIAKMKRQCRTSALWLAIFCQGGKSVGIFEGIGVRRIRSKWFNQETYRFLANRKCFQCRKEENSFSGINMNFFLN